MIVAATSAFCPKCRVTMPATVEYFYRNRSRPLGLSDWCKPCTTVANVTWNARNKDKVRAADAESQKSRAAAGRARLRSVTSQLMCVDCAAFGTKLHYHHRDPETKTAAVSALRTCRWDRVLEEIEKCDPLCVKCHHGRHGYEGRRKENGQYSRVSVG